MVFKLWNTVVVFLGIFSLGVVAGSRSRVDAQEMIPDPMPDPSEGDGDVTTATTTGPAKECEAYTYDPVANAVDSFPAIWDIATILPDDTNAQDKWADIQPNVPDIEPKGTSLGDFSSVSYSPDDPDCWWTSTKCTVPKISDLPQDVWIMDEPSTLGFSFDDGPNCSHNAFYDYLQEHGQKATMFFIGSNVMDWPLETIRALDDGHELCIHGWSHRYMTALDSADAFAELYYSMEAIKLVAGVTPTCWRPPFGDVDDRIRAIATGLGLRTVLWAYDSQDWQVGSTDGFTADQVDGQYETLLQDANNGQFDNVGTMMLMHELNEFTMGQVMKYYPRLKSSFKNIVPVATGLNITSPYIESGYVMQSFADYLSGTIHQSIVNGTNRTSSSSNTANPTATSSELDNQLDNNGKTGDALRTESMGVLTVFVVGLTFFVMMRLLPL